MKLPKIRLLVCTDCKKEFETMEEAETHSEKTNHHNFKLEETKFNVSIG